MSDDITRLVLEQADRLFRQHVSREVLDAADAGTFPAALWNAVAEAGLPLALVPEASGGIGLAPPAALRLVRLAAYHAAPIPLAETMLAAWLWAGCDGDVPDGLLTLATAAAIPGAAPRVPWGADAEHVLVACDAGLALVSPETLRADRGRNLANEPRDTLHLDALPGSLRAGPSLDTVRCCLAVMRAQQLAGAMQRAMDHAVEHAGQRVQFGKAIGKFQAVQQMLSDAAGQLAAGTAAADAAADAWPADARQPGDFAFLAAVAKARAGEAAGRVAAICHQTMGAMGFTQEHELHYTTRRLWSWRDEAGNDIYWQDRLGREIAALGGGKLWERLTGT